MSKNIVIQEGGLGKQLTADKLKTNLVGGGTCLWVPEDETTLGTKVITENGTYKASDDGYYGYEQVIVSGIGSATGTDGDGDEAVATTGPDGELKITKLPSSIEVTTLPSKTIYNDGDTIDFNGIVVKAYLKTGGVWSDNNHPNGVIPLSELIFPVTTADIDSTDGETASSDLITEPFECSSSGSATYGPKPPEGEEDQGANYYRTYGITDGKLTLSGVIGRNGIDGLFASSSPSSFLQTTTYYPQGGSSSDTKAPNQQYTYNGRTVYYRSWTSNWSGTRWVLKEINPDGKTDKKAERAWSMIYGYIAPGGQDIPVQWNRPSDNKTLETTFRITVNPSAPGYGSEE